MSVSTKIVNLRERHGLNQKELAESLGMNRSVLNRIENGTRPIRDDELKIFADYFNVSADYLLERDTTKALALSDEQTTVLGAFDKLNPEGRSLFIGLLNSLKLTHSRAKQKATNVVQKNSGGTNYIAMGSVNNYNLSP